MAFKAFKHILSFRFAYIRVGPSRAKRTCVVKGRFSSVATDGVRAALCSGLAVLEAPALLQVLLVVLLRRPERLRLLDLSHGVDDAGLLLLGDLPFAADWPFLKR